MVRNLEFNIAVIFKMGILAHISLPRILNLDR